MGYESRMRLSAIRVHIERAADDEMCIYCLGVNNYISLLFF